MKKLFSILLMILPIIVMASNAADKNPLGDAQNATTGAGNLVATLMVLVIVSVWTLPAVFGFMTYHSQKKAAEQQHEDVGMKAAFYALVATIIGVAAAFYIVGSIGKATDDSATTLTAGNAVFLKPILGAGVRNLTGGELGGDSKAIDGASSHN